MAESQTATHATSAEPKVAGTEKAAGPSVAIVGGGIAGITAAVKLIRQGFDVTLFESSDRLGGNLSSNSPDNNNVKRDIYPHIVGDWYAEFWGLLEEDLKYKREDLFQRMDEIKMAMIPEEAGKRPGDFDKIDFNSLRTPTSLANVIEDLQCGVMSARDMFLFGYNYLDLVSVPRSGRQLRVLNELDVTGYLYSRPYMNNAVANLHDDILKVIWSMPADETSAHAYQNLLTHTMTFPNETPFAWMMRGPLEDLLMSRIQKQLVKAGCHVEMNTAVTAVGCKAGRIGLTYQPPARENAYKPAPEDGAFDYVVIATTPRAALPLVLTPPTGCTSLASEAPELAMLRETETGRIPVVYLRFKSEFLEQHRFTLPRELIGFQSVRAPTQESAAGKTATADEKAKGDKSGPPLKGENKKPGGNDYDISILNLRGLWEDKYLQNFGDEGPVLILAASHATAIEAPGPGDRTFDGTGKAAVDDGTKQGFDMIKKLAEYLPFIEPGEYWDDQTGKNKSIDYDHSCVITNEDFQLFLNDTDADAWRPDVACLAKHNVFFAGDYCCTDVNMATVEAAVQSGAIAARAIQEKSRHGHKIYLQPHDIYATSPLLLAKLLMTPAAFAAAIGATYDEASQDPMLALTFPYSVAILSTSYWADWLKSAMAFWLSLLPTEERSVSGARAVDNVPDHDRRIGLLGAGVNLAAALALEGPSLAPKLRNGATQALYKTWRGTIGRVLFPKLPAELELPSYEPPADPSGGSWRTLVKKALGAPKVSPRALGDAAFGVAATGVEVLENVRGFVKDAEAGKTEPDGSVARRLLDGLREALRKSEAARAARKTGYRLHTTVYVMPAPDKLPAPTQA